MSQLKKIMESRWAGISCVLFAIANRVTFTSLYSFIGVDTKLQLVYAKNLLAGKGMGAAKYFTHDLNSPVFDTQQFFPPGFTLAIIPFLTIFEGDEHKAVLAYDILVAILFIAAIRILGKKAGLPSHLNNIVTLIAGCSQYFFFMSWSSTDAIGVTLVLFALVKTMGIINERKMIGYFGTLGIGLLFFLPFFFRYMYLPVSLLLPVLILLAGFYLKSKPVKISGSRLLLFTSVFVAGYFVFSSLRYGNAIYVMSKDRGFFPSQLEICHPFIPASFINIDFGAQLIGSVFGTYYTDVINFLKIVNGVLLVLFSVIFIRYAISQWKAKQLSDHSVFIITGAAVSFTIILLIIYLSVTYKELTWGFYRWVHGWEARYYAFIYVFIPVLLFVCLYYYKYLFRRPFARVLILAGLFLIGVEVLHGIYYNMKILLVHKDLAYIRNADSSFKKFPDILSSIREQHPGREVIVCSPDNFYLHTAVQQGHKAIFDYTRFLENGIKPSSKTILLMPIQSQDVSIIEKFIREKQPQFIMEVAGTSYFTLKIDPD